MEMSRDIFCCCLCFFGVPLLIGAAIMIYPAMKSYTPHCYLQDLYIPALNAKLLTTNSSSTIAATFIFFDIELEGGIYSEGIYFNYYNSSLAIYYARKAIASYTVPSFYKGGDVATHLHDVVETLGMPWPDAFAAVSGGSAAVFTVELATTVKVCRDFGRDEELVLLLRADVEVNSSGERVSNKPIRLVAPLFNSV